MSLSTAFTEDALDWPTSSQPRHPLWRGSKRRGHDCLSHTSHSSASQSRPGRLNNDDLVDAQVLGQVDRKFIACVFHTNTDDENEEDLAPTTGRRTKTRRKVLVLIDQHAADERIRVERFLQELCDGFLKYRPDAAGVQPQMKGVRTRVLEHPLPILLTEHEVRRLDDAGVRMAFRRWGIAFGDVENAKRTAHAASSHSDGKEGSQSGHSQANVVTVPEILGDKVRCRTATSSAGGKLTVAFGLQLLIGDELRDLVKGYIAKLASDGTPPLPLTPHVDPSGDEAEGEGESRGVGWQKAMRWCPRELHELVNSKACRGEASTFPSLSVSWADAPRRRHHVQRHAHS